jgi:hypothetical protein
VQQTEKLMGMLEQLPYMEFELSCQISADCNMPPYKGSMFHGGFGWALNSIASELMAVLFDCKDMNGHTLIKPFVLVPPTDALTFYPKHHCFQFRLKLFGHATDLFQDILAAIFIWQQMGLGESRVAFNIRHIDLQLPDTAIRVFQQGCGDFQVVHAIALSSYVQHQLLNLQSLMEHHITAFINTISPIDLRKEGRSLQSAPDSKNLSWFIAQRLAQLCLAHGNQAKVGFHEFLPKDIAPPLHVNTTVFEQNRTSGLQGTKHTIKGLTGTWAYDIDNYQQVCWLLIGSLIHVGKKSTFGFGAYDLTLAVRQS